MHGRCTAKDPRDPTGFHTVDEKLIRAAEHFDWGQPGARWEPCFHLGEDGHFCGRAPWWDGHVGGSSHRYISLTDLLRNQKP